MTSRPTAESGKLTSTSHPNHPSVNRSNLMTNFLKLLTVVFVSGLLGCTSQTRDVADAPATCAGNLPEGYVFPQPVDGRAQPLPVSALSQRLSRFRAILIGERHDRFDHHLNQLEVLCRLHARGVPVAVGFEAFEQPFQRYLDAYVAGELDLAGLLDRTEYYLRWRFDHRLYAPLFEFARANGLPMLALNVPRGVTRRLAEEAAEAGFGTLGQRDEAFFPYGLTEPPETYRERRRMIFHQHSRHLSAGRGAPKRHRSEGASAPEGKLSKQTAQARGRGDYNRERHGKGKRARAAFDRFVRVQWMWDAAMAQRAVRYLREHPERTLVVIAGSGHVAYEDAIPGRMAATWSMLGAPPLGIARVLQGARRHEAHGGIGIVATYGAASPEAHDVWLKGPELLLPPVGKLGVYLEGKDGDVSVTSVAENSGADEAGIKAGDRLISVAGTAVGSYAEVKLALGKYRAGDTVAVDVIRPGETVSNSLRGPLSFDVRLR